MADAVRSNQELYALHSNEVTHGTLVAPATSLGYVTSARASGRENVRIHDGIGAQQQSRHGMHEGEGEVKFLAQDNQKTWSGYAYRSAGVLQSNSVGIGTTDHGLDLVGAKIDGITYDFGFDKPLEITTPLMAMRCVEDADGGTAATLAGDILDFLTGVLTGGLANMQVVEGTLAMSNACQRAPGHMGSRTADQARHGMAIKEGGGESSGSVKCLLPYDSGVGDDDPTAVTVTITYTVGVNTWVPALTTAELDGASFDGDAGDGIAQYGYELKHVRTALAET